MNAIEYADMIERYNAGVMSQKICEDYKDAADELRRLAAVEAELVALKKSLAAAPAAPSEVDMVEGADWHDELTRFAALVRVRALDEAIKIIEEYRIPVGNSAAGELACEWTRDALKEIRDAILALKEQA